MKKVSYSHQLLARYINGCQKTTIKNIEHAEMIDNILYKTNFLPKKIRGFTRKFLIKINTEVTL